MAILLHQENPDAGLFDPRQRPVQFAVKKRRKPERRSIEQRIVGADILARPIARRRQCQGVEAAISVCACAFRSVDLLRGEIPHESIARSENGRTS